MCQSRKWLRLRRIAHRTNFCARRANAHDSGQEIATIRAVRKVFLPITALLLAPLLHAFGQGEAAGVIKATTKLWEDGSKSTTIVDPDQRTAEETVTNAAGKTLRKITYLLDERNFALGAIHYDAKGGIRYKETYTRDAADHVIESAYAGPDGRALGRRVFVYRGDKLTGVEDYDAQGNKITPAQPASQARPDKHKR